MKHSGVVVWICISCAVSWAWGWKFQSIEYDEEVIDFTDMGSYNHGFQKNLNTGRNGLKPPGVVEEENVRITRYSINSERTDGQSEDFPNEALSSKIHGSGTGDLGIPEDQIRSIEILEASRTLGKAPCPSVDDTTAMKFMKRVVASLLRQMNVQGHVFGPGEAITIDLQAEISHADFMTLNRFVNSVDGEGDKYLTRVDLILSNMLHIVVLPSPQNVLETLKDMLVTVFDVCLTPRTIISVFILSVVVVLVTILVWRARHARSVYHLISYGFLVVFLVSCVWSFLMLYETAKAENHAQILQSRTRSMPADCDFETMGLMESVNYYLRVHIMRHQDRCNAYYKKILVDPLLTVSPVEAISETFARLVFHPAGYIGEKVGSFFKEASEVFPVWFQPFVLLLLFFFVFTGVFGFKVKTPFLSIEAPGLGIAGANGHVGNNMLPQPEPQQQQQIAEKAAGDVVRVETRDACVDTSDFEEYLRASLAAEEERERERLRTPELPSTENTSLYFPFLGRFNYVFKVLHRYALAVVHFLDMLLRCVPFIGRERAPFSVD